MIIIACPVTQISSPGSSSKSRVLKFGKSVTPMTSGRVAQCSFLVRRYPLRKLRSCEELGYRRLFVLGVSSLFVFPFHFLPRSLSFSLGLARSRITRARFSRGGFVLLRSARSISQGAQQQENQRTTIAKSNSQLARRKNKSPYSAPYSYFYTVAFVGDSPRDSRLSEKRCFLKTNRTKSRVSNCGNTLLEKFNNENY